MRSAPVGIIRTNPAEDLGAQLGYPPKVDAIVTNQNPPTTSPFRSIRAVDYTVIFVRDIAAMRRFYEGVLCFPLTRELSAGWIEYQIGGNTLALARPNRWTA